MDKKPEKIVLIINGEPIEVCATSLTISSRRAKNTLKLLKKQSRESAHSFRFFWTDVIMLNIMTNQLLQSIDTASLKRMVKPITSLEDDLEEYRQDHKRKIERLQDTIIRANDNSLPLDYSHELEKYFKTNLVDDEENEENTDSESENISDAKKEENIIADISSNEHSQNISIAKENIKDKKMKSNENTENQKESIKTLKPLIDDDEVEINFSDETKINAEIDKKENAPSAQNDLQKNIVSFTQTGEIDINSLFE